MQLVLKTKKVAVFIVRFPSILFLLSVSSFLSFGQSSQTVPDYPVQIVAQNSGKCLQASYASTRAGYWIQQLTCNGSVGQLWTFLPQSDGSYQIKSANSGMLMVVAKNSSAPSASVIQWPQSSSIDMNWNVQPSTNFPGDFQISYESSGDCLNVYNSNVTNYTKIVQDPCSSQNNQAFQLVDSHNVSLSWSPSSSGGITGYYVYRGSNAAGPFSKLSGLLTDQTYVDGAVTAGQTYYYVTTATNGTQESPYSNQVQAVVP